jgi:tight adherence protein B
MVITGFVFLFVFACVFGAYWFFVVRVEQQAARSVRQRLGTTRKAPAVAALLKARERLSAVGPVDAVLKRVALNLDGVPRLLARAGLHITPGALILASVFCACIGMFAGMQVTGTVSVGLVAAVAAGCLPYLYVRRAATKRIAKFEEQFPDVIDLMARALRAGHALPTALQLAADEAPNPVGAELRLLADQQNYGMSLPDALKAFAARVPLLDAGFFVTAVLTQREMGGNLSEVLDNLAAVIRERFKVKRQVRVVSAHGRITGVVLGCLPPAVAFVLFLISPAHIRVLVEDPIGLYLVAAGVTLQCIGVLWIRRVVNVEY